MWASDTIFEFAVEVVEAFGVFYTLIEEDHGS